MTTRSRQALLLLLLASVATPLMADPVTEQIEELQRLRDTTVSLLNLLVDQGLISRDKANELIAQAEKRGQKIPDKATLEAQAAAAQAAANAGTVRVPYIPDAVKQDITDDVRQAVIAKARSERWGDPGTFPEWLRRINLAGDFRFRWEADRYPNDTSPNVPAQIAQQFGVNLNNTTVPENRWRLRARFGAESNIGDSVTTALRLSTGAVGNGANPVSENQTLGNYNSRSAIGFDRALLSYHPSTWFVATFGRLGNPFFVPTSLMWSDDLSLEGGVFSLRPHLTGHLTWFTTAGAFPIQQISPTPLSRAQSKWLYGYQSGLDFRFGRASSFRIAAGLYDYRHVEGIPNPDLVSTPYSLTAAPFRQTGNTVFDINGLVNVQNGTQNYVWGLASKFREATASAQLDLDFVGPTHVILDGDYVRNIGFKADEILARTGYTVKKQVTGWQSRLTVGYPNLARRHSWQASITYRYIQRDAVLDAFTDSDFHFGGTDAKGFIVGGRYSIEPNTAIGLRWLSSKQIDGVALAGADAITGLPLSVDMAQLDLTSTF
jgi:hypothetical protein